MNILFLTQVVPFPLDAGPKVRSYHMLRYLAQRHAITLVSFVRDDREASGLEHLREFCHAVHAVPITRSRVRDVFYLLASLLRREPFLITRDRVPAMHARLAQLAAENAFDWVHADQLGMAQYALALPHIPKLLDEHNAVWTIVQRMSQNARPGPAKLLMEIEWRQLQRYEARTCARFDRVLTVSEQDRQALQSLTAKPLPITTLPICIDVETTPQVEPRPEARDVLCVGGMFYPPNVDGVVWFADEVLPLVGRTSPDSKFWVVGARPDRRIVERAAQDPHVRVTGYVAETTEFFRDSAVFAVPLRAGGGMRVKILDAWARGIPVVSTTIGCEGIEVRPEENILIADTPAEFAQAVVKIICDPAVRQRLAANGRRWVENRYNWRVTYREMERVYAAPYSSPSDSLRVLYVVPYAPTLVRTRPRNLIRGLARRGVRVTLATVWSNARERAELTAVGAPWAALGVEVLAVPLSRVRSLWNCLQVLPRAVPLQSVYAWQPALIRLIESQMTDSRARYDVIHVEHLRGAIYGQSLRQQSRTAHVPIVWDSVDCISFLFEQAVHVSRNSFGRYVTRLELPRTRRHEPVLAGQFDHVLVTSAKDQAAFAELAQRWNGHRPSAPMSVLSNGVDLDYFRPVGTPRDERTVIFTGKLSYHANVTAVQFLVNEIMPRVWAERPDACVQIVGQNPPRQVLGLAERDPERVAVVGTVPDLRPYLWRATVAVAPILYGAGVQNKVLEAMASGVPVVATPQAVAALAVQDGTEILLGNSAQDLARHLVCLLSDHKRNQTMALNGRHYVEREHDWDQVAGRLEGIYRTVIAEREHGPDL